MTLVFLCIGAALVAFLAVYGPTDRCVQETVTTSPTLTNARTSESKQVVSLETWLASLSLETPLKSNELLVCTAHCGESLYIDAQVESLNKFCQVPYRLVVLNDATTTDKSENIHRACEKHAIQCIDIPEALHTNRRLLFPETTEPDVVNAVTRCADGIQVMFNIFRKTQGFCMVLDADCVAVDFFDPKHMIPSPFNHVGVAQSRGHVEYIWNAFLLFDMSAFPSPELMNADSGRVDGFPVDVMGQWYSYCKKTDNWPYHIVTDENSDRFAELLIHTPKYEIFDGKFVHFHNSSQWDPKKPEIHKERAAFWLNWTRKQIQLHN